MAEKIPDYVVRVSAGQKVQPKILSIRGSDDAFDRYKMRQLFVQIVGKGKMIRTSLLNVDDVAHDLKVEPEYIGAYFGYELGAQSKYDGKKPDRERGSISGEHDSSMLSSLMSKFIKEIVLCTNCGLPENTLSLDKKSSEVYGRCSSCGNASTVQPANPKFAKYMVSHPPSVTNTKPVGKKSDTPAQSDPPKNNKPTPKPKQTKKSDDGDDNDWAVSLDPEEVKKRQLQVLTTPAVQNLILEDKETNDPAEAFKAFISANHSTAEIIDEVKRLQALPQLKMTPIKTTRFLFDALFTPQNIILKDTINNSLPVMLQFVVTEKAQHAFLARLESLVDKRPELVKKFPTILHNFYENNVIGEAAIFAWHEADVESEYAEPLRRSTDDMIMWLKSSNEDGEEDGEGEDGDE